MGLVAWNKMMVWYGMVFTAIIQPALASIPSYKTEDCVGAKVLLPAWPCWQQLAVFGLGRRCYLHHLHITVPDTHAHAYTKQEQVSELRFLFSFSTWQKNKIGNFGIELTKYTTQADMHQLSIKEKLKPGLVALCDVNAEICTVQSARAGGLSTSKLWRWWHQ